MNKKIECSTALFDLKAVFPTQLSQGISSRPVFSRIIFNVW